MITVFANQKGGVGKSTHSTAFAWECMLEGHRVALVDADPQRSILIWSDHREINLPNGITLVAMAKKTIHRDIQSLAEDYDHVVIDTPGRATDITRSAILAGDLIIVPCGASARDVWSSMDTIDLIIEAQIFKPSIRCAILINGKVQNTKLATEVQKTLKELAPNIPLLDSEICHRQIYKDCAKGLSIQEVAKKGIAREEIQNVYREVMGKFYESKN